MDSVEDVLKKLGLPETGHYDNHFYVIELEDSNEYAKMYTQLSAKAINTEYPGIGTNSAKTTVKITNYFEVEVNSTPYNIFLIADFDQDRYTVKIGEK